MPRILLVASFVILVVSVSLSLLTLEEASANRDQIETAAREALSRVRPFSSGQTDQPLSAVRTSPHTYEAAIVNLGGYFNYGNRFISAGNFRQSRPAFGAGALLELELTTRLAFSLRAGWSRTNRESGGWDDDGFAMSAGVAIY